MPKYTAGRNRECKAYKPFKSCGNDDQQKNLILANTIKRHRVQPQVFNTARPFRYAR